MKLSLILSVFLSTACLCAAQEPRTQFLPGQAWPDNHGVHINAHGGGVLFHAGTYYWFEEHKIAGTAGNEAQVGVHSYHVNPLLRSHVDGGDVSRGFRRSKYPPPSFEVCAGFVNFDITKIMTLHCDRGNGTFSQG